MRSSEPIRDDIEARVQDFVANRLDDVRQDRTAHNLRLAKLLPSLVEEFGATKSGEEIRDCADAILTRFDDVPVRSFVLMLALRQTRECLREKVCAALA